MSYQRLSKAQTYKYFLKDRDPKLVSENIEKCAKATLNSIFVAYFWWAAIVSCVLWGPLLMRLLLPYVTNPVVREFVIDNSY